MASPSPGSPSAPGRAGLCSEAVDADAETILGDAYEIVGVLA